MKLSQTLIIILCVLTSCKNDSGSSSKDELTLVQQEQIEAYFTDNSLTGTKSSEDVYYVIEQENPTGRTQAVGGILSIYYTMSVFDGQEVSSHQAADGDPIRLEQGVDAVVPVGLDLGLSLMREGEIYEFYLTSNLAFGSLSSSGISANSAIVVEVELVKIESASDLAAIEVTEINDYIATNNLNNTIINPLDPVSVKGSGLRYKKMSTGNGSKPAIGETVRITYQGTFTDKTVFDAASGSDIFEFEFGAGEILNGLEEGVGLMDKGERALLILPSNLGYGASVRVIPDFMIGDLIEGEVIPDYVEKVPPFEILLFDVRLTQ